MSWGTCNAACKNVSSTGADQNFFIEACGNYCLEACSRSMSKQRLNYS